MSQLIEDLISAMEYHVEQTRPIHSTTVALQAAREALVNLPPQRTWAGLTEDDRVLIKHDANFNQFMTAGEYADRVQQLTEARLKDLNT